MNGYKLHFIGYAKGTTRKQHKKILQKKLNQQTALQLASDNEV